MGVKRNKKLPVLIVFVLIVIVLAVSYVYDKMHENTPTEEMADLSRIYTVEEGTAAVIANGVLSEARGIYQNKTVYLNLGIVRNELNHHFYWDDAEKLLTCTTAAETARADAGTSFHGAPVFLELEDGDSPDTNVYISLDYVANYTNILVETYTNPARVFIRTHYGSCQYATVLDEAAIRVEANVKSPVLTKAAAGSRLWVIAEGAPGWLKVYAGGENGGFVGYADKADMAKVETVEDAGPYQAPAYTRQVVSEPICLGWHQVFQDSGVDDIEKLLEDTQGLNVLVPTWFSIMDSEGTVETRASEEYVTLAHEKGLQIWALVENLNTDIKLDNARLLNRTSSRTRVIETLIEQALQYNIDGLNVDLEGLPSSAGDGYIQFIRELSVECRRNGLVLSVDNYVPSAWTTHYQRDLQAEVIDYLIVMAYDEHYNGSEAGSTASLSFVDNGIADTIAEGVPAEMIICGIPFYSRIWSGDGNSLTSETISMPRIQSFIEANEVDLIWESELGQNYAETTVDGVLTRIWVEDVDSIRGKLDTLAKYPLAGMGCWKLGMESDDVWSVIAEYLQR